MGDLEDYIKKVIEDSIPYFLNQLASKHTVVGRHFCSCREAARITAR